MIREHSCHGALPDRSVDWPALVGLAVWCHRLYQPSIIVSISRDLHAISGLRTQHSALNLCQ